MSFCISLVRMVGCRTYIEESDDCSYNACSNEQPNISDYILNAMAIMPTAIMASNMVPLMRPIQVVFGVAALYHVFFLQCRHDGLDCKSRHQYPEEVEAPGQIPNRLHGYGGRQKHYAVGAGKSAPPVKT